jgi:hypothetical protein
LKILLFISLKVQRFVEEIKQRVGTDVLTDDVHACLCFVGGHEV